MSPAPKFAISHINRRLIIWLAALVLFVFCLWLFRAILVPFVVAIAIAYFLDPVADWLERRGIPRLAAVIAITILFLLALLGSAIFLIPLLIEQGTRLAEQSPAIGAQITEFINEFRSGNLAALLQRDDGIIGEAVAGARAALIEAADAFIQRLVSGGLGFLNLVGLMFITPVVAFYLLLEWDDIVAQLDRYLPRDHGPTIRSLARQIDKVISGYARGMASVCLILAVFYGAALSLIGLEYGLIVGVLAGLLSFIPYFGAIAGFLASGILALIQYWPDPVMIGVVVGIFVLGQIIEGNFITPRLVGKNVGLHPVWVIFALLAFSSVFGFAGLLLAVPIAATIGVLVRFGLSIYLDSSLYLGEIHDLPADPNSPLPQADKAT